MRQLTIDPKLTHGKDDRLSRINQVLVYYRLKKRAISTLRRRPKAPEKSGETVNFRLHPSTLAPKKVHRERSFDGRAGKATATLVKSNKKRRSLPCTR